MSGDVFGAFQRDVVARHLDRSDLAALTRDWFRPLVEFAESIEATSELYPALGAEATAALAQLRARAEAGGKT